MKANASSYWRFSSASARNSLPSSATFCGSSLRMRSLTPCTTSFCWRCSSETSRASCSLLPRWRASSARMASSWLFRSSRLRRNCCTWSSSSVRRLAVCSSLARSSMIALRASLSGKSWACAAAANSSSTAAAMRALVTSLVLQFGAAVLGPRGLVAAGRRRPLLSETHRFELRVGDAQEGHRSQHRLGPLLTEREVVLAAAALVGMALDRAALAAVGCHALGMGLNQRAVLVLDHEAVEVEVDDARRTGACRRRNVDGRHLRLRRALAGACATGRRRARLDRHVGGLLVELDRAATRGQHRQ